MILTSFYSLLLAAFAALSPCKKKDPKPIGDNIEILLKNYHIVFQDILTPIDWNKWDWREPWSGDQPTQKENTMWVKENTIQEDRGVCLQATREGDLNYCGMISSHKFLEWKYGYVEVSAKIPPEGFKYWFAIWMYDKNGWLPEVDILEMMKETSQSLSFTHHWLKNGVHESDGNTFKWKQDFSNDFHRYGLLWESDKLVWYVDGLPYYECTSNIPDVPLFLICNIQSQEFKRLFLPNEIPMCGLVDRITLWQK